MPTPRIALCCALLLLGSSTPAVANSAHAMSPVSSAYKLKPAPTLTLFSAKPRVSPFLLTSPRIIVENRAIHTRAWLEGRRASMRTLASNSGGSEIAWGSGRRGTKGELAGDEEKQMTLEDATSPFDLGTCTALGVVVAGIGIGVLSGQKASDRKPNLDDACSSDGACPLTAAGTPDNPRMFQPITAWSVATGTFALGMTGVLIIARPNGQGAKVGARGTF